MPSAPDRSTLLSSTDSATNASILEVSIVHDQAVNFAFQQNMIPIVREIVVRNCSEASQKNLVVRLFSEPAFSVPYEFRVQEILPDQEFRLDSIKVILSPTFLAETLERVQAIWHLEVRSDETLLASQASSVAILARNEWCGLSGLPEILAAFVLPNDQTIGTIIDRASNLLREATNRSSFNGYQDLSRKRVGEQLAAIYLAIAAEKIRYIVPPASFETSGQKVRLPTEIWNQRFGTCLDLSLLFAACCERVGLNALLLLHQGHSYAGCWLDEQTLPLAAVDDLQAIRKLVSLQELVVFETTLLTSDSTTNFDLAVKAAHAHLAPESAFRMAIDVSKARSAQIRPLSIGEAASSVMDRSLDAGHATPLLVGTSIEDKRLPTSTAPSTRQATRIDEWMSRLLDLTKRNRLLNFKATAKTIQLLCPDPTKVEDELAAETDLALMAKTSILSNADPRNTVPRAEREALLNAHLLSELKNKRLFTNLEDAEHNRRMIELYREAKNAVEENGTNTLFAAVGVLEWKESEHAEKTYRAPILLIPVEIKRKSIAEGFILRRVDEDTRLNVTLMEFLRQEFEKEIPGLNPLPEDESGVDVSLVFRLFEDAIKNIAGWEVKKEVWVGQFSFNKHLLWKDLSDRLDTLKTNRVVRHLIDNAGQPYPISDDDVAAEGIDQRISHAELFCPRSADSSQIAAMLATAAGHDLVIEGPPGTGKSQTITNIISHCLALNKTVLFVAEKRAALDVVHRRLKDVGLDPFCLELHSNKVGKGDVLKQFDASLQYIAKGITQNEWHTITADLEAHRDRLNAYVEELHNPSPCGLSAYDCFDYLLSKQDLSFAPLPEINAGIISTEGLHHLRQLVLLMKDRGPAISHYFGSPLGLIKHQVWSPQWAQETQTSLLSLAIALQQCEDSYKGFSTWLGTDNNAADERSLEAHAKLADALLSALPVGPRLLDSWSNTAEFLREMEELSTKRAVLRAQLQGYDEAKLLALDIDALDSKWRSSQASWFIPKFFGSLYVRGVLGQTTRDLAKPKAEVVLSVLENGKALAQVSARILSKASEAKDILGSIWQSGEPEATQIAQVAAWGAAINKALLVIVGEDFAQLRILRGRLSNIFAEGPTCCAHGTPIGTKFEQFLTLKQSVDSKLAALLQRASFCVDSLCHSKAFHRDLRLGCQFIIKSWSDIRAWNAWNEIKHKNEQAGLTPVVTHAMNVLGESATLDLYFERSFRRTLINSIIDAGTSLRSFFLNEHQSAIQRFIQLDEEVAITTRKVIAGRLAARIPRGQMIPKLATEMAVLSREILKKTRHIPVRQLLNKIPNLAPKLKPCVLMSPLSVAQYLDANHANFDIVIFDEASQIPVWDAVGAIARGTQLIVVGDSKQLPPTSFFSRSTDDEMDDESSLEVQKDMPSILEDLQACVFRKKSLLWHYRSRQEGLITFSNKAYYNNELLTFPSTSVGFSGITFRLVANGVYDKAGSRTNRKEAEALVSELISRLKDPNLPNRSYGIVTFSQAQQELVLNLLEEECRKDPTIENHFGDTCPVVGEPVFVKNLENVQGDERDVILFSICYGPDKSGRISMNFGPLNRDGGQRRLNVAITRAKHEMVVFSSITGEKIDLTHTRATGVKDLRNFLLYAERGTQALVSNINDGTSPDGPKEFTQMVASQLEAAGFIVHQNVGCSGYRIDLAVAETSAPGCYIAAIECDGSNYLSACSARDRDKLRRQVLEGLGWRVIRIWSTDWWLNPGKQIERLIAEIKERPQQTRDQIA